ncbi:glycosyltransferase family A protein [Lysinibacillus pakistanensis]|uniref:glycosyltransferase family 2 protein n=1 Tax=Lysinibacillus pakistanensis TaxID=759811 RepID=UPI003D2DFC03
MKIPLSIVITTYNRERELRRCIKSIIDQKYDGYEIIVVDDHSSTLYQNTIEGDFPDVRYFYQAENKGPGIARNRGIQEAKFNYVVIMDDDDVFVEGAFDKINDFLLINEELNEPVYHFLCSTTKINENRDYRKYSFKEYLQGVVTGDTTHIINKEIFCRNNYAFPNSKIGAELLLWYKINIEHGYTVVNKVVVKVMEDSRGRLTNANKDITKVDLFAQYQRDIIREFEKDIVKVGNINLLLTKFRGAITYSLIEGDRQLAMKYLLKSLNYSKKQLMFIPLFLLPKKVIAEMLRKYRQ